MTFTKRYSYGLSLLADYTYSKQEEAPLKINPINPYPITEIGTYSYLVVPSGRNEASGMPSNYDVLVAGSGASGGWTCKRWPIG